MIDRVGRLNEALGDKYRIERELGAGGMATVYIAEDLKHHRQVAFERAVATSSPFGGQIYEPGWYTQALVMLGDLYAARGDRAKAAEYYRRYIDVFRNPDPRSPGRWPLCARSWPASPESRGPTAGRPARTVHTPARNRMRTLISLMIFVASAAGAQYPPKALTNLKVLPAGIRVDSLLDVMAGFTRALGVRCTYCHAGRDGQPLDSIDFASDTRLAKEKARVMLRMVDAINGEHLTRLATRRTPAASVSCFTCHHGVAVPRPLQQILLGAYAAGGIDSLLSSYRILRARYYGGAAYDFGEVALVDVANFVRSSGPLADALRLYQLNVEMVPASTFALRALAGGSLAAGDTAAAIASYERALAINPNDGQSRAALERLRRR